MGRQYGGVLLDLVLGMCLINLTESMSSIFGETPLSKNKRKILDIRHQLLASAHEHRDTHGCAYSNLYT